MHPLIMQLGNYFVALKNDCAILCLKKTLLFSSSHTRGSFRVELKNH